ncbi:MAG: adenylate/guanylate cyclase domain-containing protein [Reyranella sp.]|uniref:adenylate/guanylate cyclase domain-containing protein n=1 Tax=Reyranella sp. TaxID=1929291 RepID=UPI00120ED7A4|nr:adenylate/guanylate cyclase domain-containing protein [Reyranella sp.]TAJ89029.1 MAG: adenylate/guanylate cyclase domain-containing protein [Reyranella sp.]TBR30066.1 MAG: adenylate/guanylate cyclase domain-containing protein [Reyranella sp.]
MTMSRRNRREWRIILWICLTSAVISGYFGYAVAPADQAPLWGAVQGILTSLLIATPVAFFEVRRARINSLVWMRRLPLASYFLVKVVFYCVVILVGLVLSRLLMSIGTRQFVIFDPIFRNSVLFSVGMSVVGNLIIETGRLLGFGTLKNLLLGRYARPRSEQRAFLLIDMKDSTGLAEKLGAIQFHELLNAFFRDIADAALECDAEIHKYVGDEVILTWPEGLALSGGDCLGCAFLARRNIARNAARYRDRFGAVPEFRAALHCGEIVAGEIGDVRREIAYVGDTLNVAARLLESSKTLGRDVLVSAELLEQSHLPHDLQVEPLPTLTIRGRDAPLEIAALSLRADRDQG